MARKSKKKKFLKHIIKYNIFDYFIPKLRRIYKKLGILEFMDERVYWLTWKLCRIFLMKKLWQGSSKGFSQVPPTGAAIFVANHSHALDPFFSGCQVYRTVSWLSKIENYQLPFFRPILQMTGSIPVRRGKSDNNAIRLVKKKIAKGGIIGMFPEGTRTRDGYLGRFHTGAARLCIEHQIPYIPCGIIGSFHTKAGDKIQVNIGKPVYPPKDMVLTYENMKAFTENMRQDIIKLSHAKVKPIVVAEQTSHQAHMKDSPAVYQKQSISKSH